MRYSIHLYSLNVVESFSDITMGFDEKSDEDTLTKFEENR